MKKYKRHVKYVRDAGESLSVSEAKALVGKYESEPTKGASLMLEIMEVKKKDTKFLSAGVLEMVKRMSKIDGRISKTVLESRNIGVPTKLFFLLSVLDKLGKSGNENRRHVAMNLKFFHTLKTSFASITANFPSSAEEMAKGEKYHEVQGFVELLSSKVLSLKKEMDQRQATFDNLEKEHSQMQKMMETMFKSARSMFYSSEELTEQLKNKAIHLSAEMRKKLDSMRRLLLDQKKDPSQRLRNGMGLLYSALGDIQNVHKLANDAEEFGALFVKSGVINLQGEYVISSGGEAEEKVEEKVEEKLEEKEGEKVEKTLLVSPRNEREEVEKEISKLQKENKLKAEKGAVKKDEFDDDEWNNHFKSFKSRNEAFFKDSTLSGGDENKSYDPFTSTTLNVDPFLVMGVGVGTNDFGQIDGAWGKKEEFSMRDKKEKEEQELSFLDNEIHEKKKESKVDNIEDLVVSKKWIDDESEWCKMIDSNLKTVLARRNEKYFDSNDQHLTTKGQYNSNYPTSHSPYRTETNGSFDNMIGKKLLSSSEYIEASGSGKFSTEKMGSGYTKKATGRSSIFVGNLDGKVEKDELAEFFTEMVGELDRVCFRVKYAFVDFRNKESIDIACNLKEPFINGQKLNIRVADLKQRHGIDEIGSSKTIYVNPVSSDTTKKEIGKYFEQCGIITDIRVNERGFAHIDFEDHGSVKFALINLHGTVFKGHNITVDVATDVGKSLPYTNEVFLGHLNKSLRYETLKQWFDTNVGKSGVIKIALKSGYAYVSLTSKEMVAKVLSLDDSFLMGYEMDIYPCTTSSITKEFRVIVEGLNNSVKIKDIKKFFRTCGLIFKCKIMGGGRCCQITFVSPSAVKNALRMSGTRLKRCTIRVSKPF